MKKTSVYLNIVLSVAVLLLTIKLAMQPNKVVAAAHITQAATLTPNVSPAQPQPMLTAEVPATDTAKTAPKAKEQTKEKAAKEKAPAAKAQKPQAATPLVISTAELGAGIRGFAGPTPVEITIVDGKVKSIKALPNQETPEFFDRVVASGLLNKWNGKTIDKALETEVDAVTGATFTSKGLIKNVRKGLEQAKKQ